MRFRGPLQALSDVDRTQLFDRVPAPDDMVRTTSEAIIDVVRHEGDAALISLAREAGYQTTLTTDPGANRRGDDPFRIKRMFVDGSCTTAQFAELLQIQRYPACASGQTPSTRNTP